MPRPIHTSEGLTIVKNENNQFAVVSLLFTADPAKRSEEWKREAAAGMTPEQFQREYLIDYTAVMGSKVFPEIQTLRSDIMVAPPYPEFHASQRFWGGFDYGTRNPSAFLVFTILDGVWYVVWELYRPCKNIPEYIAWMKECPYWNSIRYISADPSIWAPTQQQTSGPLISVYDQFWQSGLRLFAKGRRDPQAEDSWTAMMRQHWRADDCTLKIFDCCPNLVHEFETAIYTNQSERQLLTTSYRETIADVNNHALDACKYFMLSRPPVQAPTEWGQATMINKWAIQGKGGVVPAPSVGRKPIHGYR